MKKVLINCANLHVGGALQVASSFIFELQYQKINAEKVNILVSSEVETSLGKLNMPSNVQIHNINTYGLKALFKFGVLVENYDVAFTIFGPKYSIFKAKNEIVGFAQPWISTPKPIKIPTIGILKKIKFLLKYKLQELFFLQADILVVELEHVKTGLHLKRLFKKKEILVVHNSIPSLYHNPKSWLGIDHDFSKDILKIGYITRDYDHKNIQILVKVTKILKERGYRDFKFYFTLSDDEWSKYKYKFSENAINIGVLNTHQCPTFYRNMDVTIFPSLLECFSVTPLESIFMDVPLLASDRGFVKNVCMNNATYFDPLNPEDICEKIIAFLSNHTKYKKNVLPPKNIDKFMNPSFRAKKYVDIINNKLMVN